MEQILFVIYALAACGGALAVVLSQNVVRMAFWLIISLGAVAGLFFLAGADFVGATQLLIYVGGTVVLLIFGVMLTASGPYLTLKSSPGEVIQAGLIGAVFLAVVLGTIMRADWEGSADRIAARFGGSSSEHPGYNQQDEGRTARDLGAALSGVRFDKDLGSQTGQLSTGYVLPFEIISMHLLVVLIGASYLARAKRRVPDAEPAAPAP